jgi:serine/threonine protein kinase
MAFVVWLWVRKKDSGAPAHKHSVPQCSQSESVHPENHNDNLVSTTSHTLPKCDMQGSLTTNEPSSGSLALVDPIQVLTKQLNVMHRQGILLRGRYRILGSSEQRSGSQGVVRFARLAVNPSKQFAIKFFTTPHHFEVEQGLYSNPSLLDFLPPTDDVSSNDLEPHVLGRALPPMIVTERGESLDEWTHRCKPDFYMCLSIVGHLAERVKKIHGAGLVHRDLKPANVMWLPSVNGFTVIDFGSVARASEEAGISCTLAYAAPEAVAACAKGETRMSVTGALDVWSLGIIFYEFLTGSRVLACSRHEIFAAAAGEVLFPWEQRNTPQQKAHMRRLGLLRGLILAMLDRDPAGRITMIEMKSRLSMLMKRETTV